RAVAYRIYELVRMPACGQRSGLRLAVPHDAEDSQPGVVEGGPVRVHEGVTELSALVDRARCLGRVVTGDAARKRKLPEQLTEAGLVHRHVWIALGVRALEVGVGDPGRAAVARTHDVDGVEVSLLDGAIGVRVDEVQAGRRPPMAEQPGFDVLERQRALH